MTDINLDMFRVIMHVAIRKANATAPGHELLVLRRVQQFRHRHHAERFVVMLTVNAAQHERVIPGEPLPVIQMGEMVFR